MILDRLNKVYNALVDDESKRLFEARLALAIGGDIDKFEDIIADMYNDWTCQELEHWLSQINVRGIIIYGCGHDGKRLKRNLEKWGYTISWFCDNDIMKQGMQCEGCEIISKQTMIEKYNDYLVVIGSRDYGDEMYDSLKETEFPNENIFYSQYRLPLATRGIQYFDVFESKENEVYINCGGYDGSDLIDFCDWTNGNYKEAIVLEPMNVMCECIEKKVQELHLKSIAIYNKAAWNTSGVLLFSEAGAGSTRDEQGTIRVEAVDLDTIAGNDKEVSFIKMDIEGSELQALHGAEKVITKYKPRLAICIYHKPQDIYEIGSYLLELVPEYKFKIRHYCSNVWETVLYAYV